MVACYYCKKTLSLDVQKKNRLCPECGSDLHSCRNCVHFAEDSSEKCREPNSPWIRDRAATNQCHFFEFRTKGDEPSSDESNLEAERAKEAFRALFRDA